MTALAIRCPPVTAVSPAVAVEFKRLVRMMRRDREAIGRRFVRFGKSLARIRDARLYRAEFETFDEFCRKVWGMTRDTAYKLIGAAAAYDNLAALPIGSAEGSPILPTVESQARPLVVLNKRPDEQRAAWLRAVETAGGAQPTAKQIEAAVKQLVGPPAARPRLRRSARPTAEASPPLVEKYRPRTLDGLIGQDQVVWQLRAFLESPAPAAFIFAGATGTGKTTAAFAVATELGIACSEGEWGGLYEIKSGEQTADTLRDTLAKFRVRTLGGSGWRALIVSEGDRMSEAAALVWLDALESLPPETIVIFTTNHLDRLARRFVDRCEVLRFESSPAAVHGAAQALVCDVWRRETGHEPTPRSSRPFLGPLRTANCRPGHACRPSRRLSV